MTPMMSPMKTAALLRLIAALEELDAILEVSDTWRNDYKGTYDSPTVH